MAFSSISSSDIQAGKPITQALMNQIRTNFDALNTTLASDFQESLSGTQTLVDKTGSGTFVITDTGSTFTLPVVTNNSGNIFRFVQKGNGSSTIQGNGAETIAGSSTYALPFFQAAVLLYCDGVEWHVLGESKDVYYRTSGSASSPAVTTKSDPATGLYWPSTNLLGFTTNGVERFRIGTSSFVPVADNTYAIGGVTNRIKTIYLGDGSASTPSYTFGGETNLGIYRAGAGTMAITVGGTARYVATSTAFRPSGNNYTVGDISNIWTAGYMTTHYAGDGNGSSPTYSFYNDPDTGCYRSAPNTIRWSVGGVNVLQLDSAALQGLGSIRFRLDTGSVSAPAYSFKTGTNTGMWLNDGQLAFSVSGIDRWKIGDGTLFPAVDRQYNIGAPTLRADIVYADSVNTNNVSIAHKKLTGTFASSPGTYVNVAHGLNLDDILAVNVVGIGLGVKYFGSTTGTGTSNAIEIVVANSDYIVVTHYDVGRNNQAFDVLITYDV